MIRISDRFLRILVALIGVCILLAVLSSRGGLSIALGSFVIRSHSLIRPLIIAAVLAAMAIAAGGAAVAAALTWWWDAVERRAAAGAAVAAITVVVLAISWGTFAAGGSDSYCYLNQAELFARGAARDVEPLANDASWPGTVWSFAPAGHIPLQQETTYLVPICPAGYPILMAAARVTAGRAAMFWVTPILAGVTVLLAFVLGRRLAGPAAGLLAGWLTALSPTLLYQAVQPMNDVPAAAFWCAAVIAALQPRPIAAGLLAGVALTIRPNLVPLAALVGVMAAASGPNHAWLQRFKTLTLFGAAAAPGLAVVLAVQNAVYGSPFRSGYGDLSELFSLSNVVPNLRRYPRWVLEAHTPLVAAALLAPAVVKAAARRHAFWLLIFVVATLACYLPYVVYDAWWYTRFLLPAIPVLLSLFAAVIVMLIQRLPASWRAAVLFTVMMALGIGLVDRAVRGEVFNLHGLERKFRSVGEYAATLPDNAAFVTGFHSGSLRFYTARSTAGWGDITPGRFDDALEFLRRHGRKPYLVIEPWEEPDFRARFAADRLGALAWRPLAEVDNVRIYDLDGH